MSETKNKDVATVMNRYKISDEDKFICTMSYVAVGEYDSKNGYFVDVTGGVYPVIDNEEAFYSDFSTVASNIFPIEQVANEFKGVSSKDVLKEFRNKYKDLISLIYRDKNGKIKFSSFKSDDIDKFINKNSSFLDENVRRDSAEVDVNKMIMSITDGTFSLDELKQIRETVKINSSLLESLLDTLDLQIEASSKGESSVLLKGEDESVIEARRRQYEESLANGEMQEESSFKPKNYIDILDIASKIRKTLIAQDEPTSRVLTEIARKELDPSLKNRGILVTGGTGVGKTKMMSLIAKYMNRPFYKINATGLTIPGYVGTDIEEELWNLYLACGKDIEKTQNAIVFFDEIDKKGSYGKGDVSGRGVLNVLLPFIEGTVYDACADVKRSNVRVKIDTSNMIPIFGGAFEDVYKQIGKNRGVGFNAEFPSENKACVSDFVDKAGFPDEFMGRVAVIKLNDLDVEAIKRVLLESDESALKKQERIFDKLGVKLTSTPEYVERIAREAVDRKTGARGINTVVDESTWAAFSDVYTNLGDYSEVVLTDRTVDDPHAYQKIKK